MQNLGGQTEYHGIFRNSIFLIQLHVSLDVARFLSFGWQISSKNWRTRPLSIHKAGKHKYWNQ